MIVPALIGASLTAGALAAPRPVSPQAVFQDAADIVDLIFGAEQTELVKDEQKWNWSVVNELDPLKRMLSWSAPFIPGLIQACWALGNLFEQTS